MEKYFFVGTCAWVFVLLVLTADKIFSFSELKQLNHNIMALLNLLLIAAIVGMLGAIISKLWGGIENFLAWLLSFIIPGVALGMLLFLIMGFGYMIGNFQDVKIFGVHSFVLGLVIGTACEIVLSIKNFLTRR